MCRAVAQQSGGWMATWEQEGGRQPSHSVRLNAILKALKEPSVSVSDLLLEATDSELLNYLVDLSSLCATPAMLWRLLSRGDEPPGTHPEHRAPPPAVGSHSLQNRRDERRPGGKRAVYST